MSAALPERCEVDQDEPIAPVAVVEVKFIRRGRSQRRKAYARALRVANDAWLPVKVHDADWWLRHGRATLGGDDA